MKGARGQWDRQAPGTGRKALVSARLQRLQGPRLAVAVLVVALLAAVAVAATWGGPATLAWGGRAEAATASGQGTQGGSVQAATQGASQDLKELLGDLVEHAGGRYYRLVDEEGRLLTMTARPLYPGDSYIASDNRRYEVEIVTGETVRMRYVETIQLPDVTADIQAWDKAMQAAGFAAAPGAGDQPGAAAMVAQGNPGGRQGVVGIFHTHSDESYVPTSGTESKQWGDIYEVGRALTEGLREQGIETVWSRANHNPHDGEAYTRSRRTAVTLLREGASSLIDVHRDAVPDPSFYETTVNGETMTKVRLVVGRQNPNRPATLEFAKRLKAVADQRLPGIIEGIFDARADYNQDLASSRSILLEFGTHTNPLDLAQRSARTFAQVIPIAAGFTPSSAPGAARQLGSGAGRSALILLVVVLVGAAGYFALNAGSWQEFVRSMREGFRKEFGLLRQTAGSGDGEAGPAGNDGGGDGGTGGGGGAGGGQ